VPSELHSAAERVRATRHAVGRGLAEGGAVPEAAEHPDPERRAAEPVAVSDSAGRGSLMGAAWLEGATSLV
jgi:hypothetical protein